MKLQNFLTKYTEIAQLTTLKLILTKESSNKKC